MLEKAIKVLQLLEENGYESYIVGGYVRDKILGIDSNDIDICTSATPKEIKEIFKSSSSPNYGSVNITYKNTNFDITTFRQEIKYFNNRIPIKLKYIKDVKKDLLRRDFTINTLCIDSKGEILDILDIKEDLDNKVIKTVGNPKYKLKEDALRILRAIRFSTILDFSIEETTKQYIHNYANLLKRISYERKKQELDKIFSNINNRKGIELITSLGLDKPLSLNKLKKITPCNDLIGIWTQLNVDDIYPFTKNEKEQMKKIRELLTKDINDDFNIYKYGLYISTVAFQIKNKDISKLNEKYKNLPIHNPKDIDLKASEIPLILNRKPDNYIKEIMEDIEKNIINKKLINNYLDIKEFIIKKYNHKKEN
ncbi:MAG: hypothetical protein VZS44_03185 [Bacilli bacterium]|nr:hypothetical protein [Bacilli bacterium]